MPLPANGTPWPPRQLTNILPQLSVWSAWYSGSPEMLSSVYGGFGSQGIGVSSDPTAQSFFGSDTGSWIAKVTQRARRWFWGEANKTPDRNNKLHVPIAADLCQASADLLFSDQVKLKAGDAKTQEYLDQLADDGFHSKLAEAAEVGAAMTGVFLRVAWDEAVADGPILTRVDADQALPEFRFDILQAVTFWQVVQVTGETVYRHLERHELNAAGNGVVIHGLYQGARDSLGVVVPLTDSGVTAGLAKMVDADSSIDTQSPGLAVVYVPNQRPQRRWRTDPLGKSYGRSDLDGIESLMDALDECYSSWMRDVRLGKSRLLVGKGALQDQGPGNGSTFDQNQEIYTTLNQPPSASKDAGSLAQMVQFQIRWQEHQQTAQQIIGDILRSAGYSAQTFGENGNLGGGRQTATEVESRERRSLLTRDRKVRIWRPAIGDITEKMLWIAKEVFNADVTPQRPEVLFADGVQESQLVLAQTALALDQAQAASRKTIVSALHPEWDEKQVEDEVKAILDEQPTVPDPTTFRPPGADAQAPEQALPQNGPAPVAAKPA